MRRVVIGLVLGLLLVLGLGGTMASAHTHIDLPNGKCVNLPADAYADVGGASDNPDNEAQNAHHGIGTAKDHNDVFNRGLCPWD